MKNIILATLNFEINKKLRKNKEINIIFKDILYKEAILEVLEKKKELDFIILDSELPGELKNEELILKINKFNKNIKIIYLINENERVKEKYIYKKILKSDLNFKILENIILEKESKIEKTKEIKNKKSIFLGNKGSGKSVLVANIGLLLAKEKVKTLIMDFDFNKTNYLIFNLKNKKSDENNIFKINSFLYYFGKYINKNEICERIYDFENKFEKILIDSSNNFSEDERLLINNSDKKIFITEPNLIEINKTKNILEKYKNKKIQSEEFEIVLNKNNINSIDDNLLRKILKNKIIGKIDYSSKFNLLINEKIKENIKNKQIVNIIKQIKGEN